MTQVKMYASLALLIALAFFVWRDHARGAERDALRAERDAVQALRAAETKFYALADKAITIRGKHETERNTFAVRDASLRAAERQQGDGGMAPSLAGAYGRLADRMQQRARAVPEDNGAR